MSQLKFCIFLKLQLFLFGLRRGPTWVAMKKMEHSMFYHHGFFERQIRVALEKWPHCKHFGHKDRHSLKALVIEPESKKNPGLLP